MNMNKESETFRSFMRINERNTNNTNHWKLIAITPITRKYGRPAEANCNFRETIQVLLAMSCLLRSSRRLPADGTAVNSNADTNNNRGFVF